MPREGPHRDSVVVSVLISVAIAVVVTWALQTRKTRSARWQPIAMGVAAAALVSGGTVWAMNRYRASKYRPPWCCQQCGYDRTGLAADAKCPECGTLAKP